MSIFEQFRSHRALSFVAHGKLSPKRVKANALLTLRNYFDDLTELERVVIELVPEAVNLRVVKRVPWARDLFNRVLAYYRQAAIRNPRLCFETCEFWEQKIERGLSSYWSGVTLARDLNTLRLHDFKFEAFRILGHQIEAVLQPTLKELLLQARISAGQYDTLGSTEALALGSAISELANRFGFAKYLSPWPWKIPLNQWRNIAQHFSTRVAGDQIIGVYGKGKNTREVVLARQELLRVVVRVHMVHRAIKTARTLFVLNNLKNIKFDTPNIEMRAEAEFFHLRSSFATQGFEIVCTDCTGKTAEVTVRDLTTGQSVKTRMVHSSQLVCPIWAAFPHDNIVVRYLDHNGDLFLTARATGEDCKAVVDGGDPIETLAAKVKFILSEAGKEAWRNSGKAKLY